MGQVVLSITLRFCYREVNHFTYCRKTPLHDNPDEKICGNCLETRITVVLRSILPVHALTHQPRFFCGSAKTERRWHFCTVLTMRQALLSHIVAQQPKGSTALPLEPAPCFVDCQTYYCNWKITWLLNRTSRIIMQFRI